ncbi:thioredoxin [Candidatus Peregrinibacteria bacterium]|nr:thioredoxin [Candidatus Peregrinibacteria bacterium]
MAATFTDANFDAEVLHSDIPVLVDFWAPWCGPCQMMGPIIEKLAEEYSGKVKIGKLDVEESPGIAEKYQIMSIPVLKIFKAGKVVQEMVGAMSADALKQKIDAHL